ncbi:MAG TPA: succinate dehydrogenase [Casimicrobiaceae bacterium]|nr:succinate dehydrogenase [Casimicrobiaceae bacterium]
MSASRWRNRGHPAYWAFLVHRLSGLALALFLPLHFVALARALRGAAALDAFLAWTRSPWVVASEIALVFALAAHLTGGLRLLLVEFVGWKSEGQKALLAVAGGVAAFCAIAFALNVV